MEENIRRLGRQEHFSRLCRCQGLGDWGRRLLCGGFASTDRRMTMNKNIAGKGMIDDRSIKSLHYAFIGGGDVSLIVVNEDTKLTETNAGVYNFAKVDLSGND